MQCDAKELAAVLARAKDFLGKSPVNPALGCFRFSGQHVEAADFDLACRLNLPPGLDFKEPVLVPGIDMQSICGNLQEMATLEPSEKSLLIADGSSKFRLATMSSGNFPAFPEEPKTYTNIPLLCQAVKSVLVFAGDPKETQVYASVRVDDDQVIAADARFKASGIASLGTKTGVDALLGLRFAELMASEEDTEIATTENRAFMRSKSGVMYGPTVEGKYVEYRRVLAKCNLPQTFVMSHPDFKAAIAKISSVARDGDSTKVRFTIKDKRMILESNRGADKATVELPVEGDGHSEFILNWQLVASWFRSTKCDKVSMSCDSSQVRVVRLEGDSNLADGRTIHLTAYVCPIMMPA